MSPLNVTHVVTFSVITHAALLWLLYIAIRRNAEYRRSLDAISNALRKTPLRFSAWRKGLPHCGGRWLVAVQKEASEWGIALVHLPHNHIASCLASLSKQGEVKFSLGPLPRFEDSPDFIS